jgi:hypothetical protein
MIPTVLNNNINNNKNKYYNNFGLRYSANLKVTVNGLKTIPNTCKIYGKTIFCFKNATCFGPNGIFDKKCKNG